MLDPVEERLRRVISWLQVQIDAGVTDYVQQHRVIQVSIRVAGDRGMGEDNRQERDSAKRSRTRGESVARLPLI